MKPWDIQKMCTYILDLLIAFSEMCMNALDYTYMLTCHL